MADTSVSNVAVIEDGHVHIGARVRLRAPDPMLELRADIGTVVRPDVWDGYCVVRLDAPATLRHDEIPKEMIEVAEAADNLEWLGATEPSPLTALAFLPCERVESSDGVVLVHPLEGGEALGFPAAMDLTLYGRFIGTPGGHAIDLMFVAMETGEEWTLSRAGTTVDTPGEVGQFSRAVTVSFPRAGRYQFQFRADGRLLATHPWLASTDDGAASC